MGTGVVAYKSSKQKLNTQSSTEAELVGATDYMLNTIWSKFFLEAQGHKITSNVFEQKVRSDWRKMAGYQQGSSRGT
jgi:truncated hemoglobin YjbI